MGKQPSSTPVPPMMPVNDETRAMLDYAASPAGRAKIEQGRQEIRDRKGIVVDQAYFDDLSRRISARRVGRTSQA